MAFSTCAGAGVGIEIERVEDVRGCVAVDRSVGRRSTAPQLAAPLPQRACSQGRQLEHLTGARCLASTWIVCGHFLPTDHRSGTLATVRYRANAAVNFFIIMSGFITHWAYGSRVVTGSLADIKVFYTRRLGRVVLTTWVAMFFGLLCLLVQHRGFDLDWWHVLRCYAFVEPWRDPADWCPNGQTWTIAALLPSWLLYPLTGKAICLLERRGGLAALGLLVVGLYALSVGPWLFVFCWQGNTIHERQGAWSYEWPPAQLTDFALGVAVAEAAAARLRTQAAADAGAVSTSLGEEVAGDCCGSACERLAAADARPGADVGLASRGVPSPSAEPADENAGLLAFLADAAIAAVVAAVFLVPPSPSADSTLRRRGWEPLFNHGLGICFALFLFCTAAVRSSRSCVARLLSHPGLVAFGAYSFEVYLFQYPWHEATAVLGELSGQYFMVDHVRERDVSPEGFVLFFMSLWLVAGLYSHFVELPLVAWLRALTTSMGSASTARAERSHREERATFLLSAQERPSGHLAAV
eukprot:TRINITY_DN19154_c0_g3_i1.p1 TRINITY_DN19154_c0_g3~~TRINITY_DN19154_c0_g3_i1.p1  ORF type:complete len:525 (+),score=96.79 TRINITY_DN19154_c0_g3_i1:78-1652(+)